MEGNGHKGPGWIVPDIEIFFDGRVITDKS